MKKEKIEKYTFTNTQALIQDIKKISITSHSKFKLYLKFPNSTIQLLNVSLIGEK